MEVSSLSSFLWLHAGDIIAVTSLAPTPDLGSGHLRFIVIGCVTQQQLLSRRVVM
jgi:hypothetical protein